MKRRSFLTAAGAGMAASAAAAAPAIAKTKAATTWRVVSDFPAAFATQRQAMALVADRVAALTGGGFRIEPQDMAGRALDHVSAARVEIGYAASSDYIDRDPAFAFDTALPFGLNARQQTAWMMFGGGDALMGALFADHNIHRLAAGNTGARMGGWFRRPITEPADLQGLRIATGGVAAEMLRRLGAKPLAMSPVDVAAALRSGTLDAAESGGPVDDTRLGLATAAPYYYHPGWWEGGAQLSLHVNAEAWARLPEGHRQALQAAAAEADRWMMAKYDAENPAALRAILAGGTKLRVLPRHVQIAGFDAAKALYAEYAGRSDRFARIHANWSQFQRDENLWFRAAGETFENFGVAVSADPEIA